MALRIRRGRDDQRSGTMLEVGELVWTTDGHQLWVGNGEAGGVPVVGSNVTGYGLVYNSQDKVLEVAGLSADDLTNGVNNKFFSTELAQDAVASMFTTGSHSNISFAYDDTQGKLNATVTLDGIGLTDIVNDTSPQLGGDLDLNSNDITGTGNISITGNVTATGGTVTASTITASAFGEINAKSVTLTDSTQNASFVLNTNTGGLTGSNFFVLNTHHNDEDPVSALFSRSKGTSTSPTALANGDSIFALTWSGYTASGQSVAGAIGYNVDGTPAPGILPGKFVIATVDATGVFLPQLSVCNDGKQELVAPSMTAGSGSGQVDTGTISSWMKINFNGVDYAVPMYAINP